MITELRLQNFKNFKDATLRLGPFTVLVGANASGKSNIRDAFRFLHGVGRGYSLADIIGGKFGGGGQLEWAPIRGAANEVIRFGATGFAVNVKFGPGNRSPGVDSGRSVEYNIGVELSEAAESGYRIVDEALQGAEETIFAQVLQRADNILSPNGSDRRRITLLKNEKPQYTVETGEAAGQPVLTRIQAARGSVGLGSIPTAVQEVLNELARIRFLELIPAQMRKPALPGQNVLGDRGENLPGVLHDICLAPDRKAIFIDWIQELTPMDIVDFEFPRDPSGLIHLLLKERSGITISAYSASDGTLRFLALLAALLGTHPAKLYFFEEIETGIHPSRLRLLLDLIERQTASNGIQVIATTHSPDLLQMISDSTFNHTSVVYRPRETDHAIIRPVAELPDAPRLRAEQGLGPLHASGWMEDVLFFNGENEQAAAK